MSIKDNIKNGFHNTVKIDLNKRINHIINKELKNYTTGDKVKEQYSVEKLINDMYSWYYEKFDRFCLERGIEDRLSLVDYDYKTLLDIYNFNELSNLLREKISKKQMNNYENDHIYNRKIKYAVLYNLIENGGPVNGPVNGLIFAKMFDLNKAATLIYGLTNKNPNLSDLIVKYLELNGPIHIDCYPHYFDGESKNRFNSIPLDEILKKSVYVKKNSK